MGCCCVERNTGCHRCMGWTVLVTTIIALAFAVIPLTSCRFINASGLFSFATSSQPDLFIGLYSAGTADTCIDYADDFLDARSDKVYFSSARAMAISTVTLLALSILMLLVILLAPIGIKGRRPLWILSCVFIGLSIATTGGINSFFGIDECTALNGGSYDFDLCVPDFAAYFVFANVFLLILLSIFTCCTPTPLSVFGDSNDDGVVNGGIPVYAQEQQEMKVTTTVEQREDGSVKVIEQRTSPDGTSEIIETVYPKGEPLPPGVELPERARASYMDEEGEALPDETISM